MNLFNKIKKIYLQDFVFINSFVALFFIYLIFIFKIILIFFFIGYPPGEFSAVPYIISNFEGTIKHIDLTACESLRYCEIRANTNKHEPESVALDLAGLNRIVELYLNDNIKTTTEVVLATPTPSPIPDISSASAASSLPFGISDGCASSLRGITVFHITGAVFPISWSILPRTISSV